MDASSAGNWLQTPTNNTSRELGPSIYCGGDGNANTYWSFQQCCAIKSWEVTV